MVREDIFNKIKIILSTQLSVEICKIEETSALVIDLGADSLDLAEIAMLIEEQFGHRISDMDISKIKVVKDIIDYLEERLEVKK